MNKNKYYKYYEKLKTVGKGSFGTATLYRRLSDNKYIVIKEIFTMDMDHEEKKSARNEAEIISTLNHANIISYLGSFEEDDSLLIIMEYADGGNLAQLIKMKKNKNELFSEKGILNLISQISNAVSYLHRNRILHRDLKTANIFLNSNGVVKVGDFGISKLLNTKSKAQTFVGTPYYLSPEMCEGSDYNEKSDIWAIGCILYELATFSKPFEAPTLPALAQKITACDYDNTRLNFYSNNLSTLIKSILQRNPDKRPSAKYIYEIVIPKILLAASNQNDFSNKLKLNNSNLNKERSILYEISNFGYNNDQEITPIELHHKKIIDFDASSTHQIVVTSDNSVYTWGANDYGQLGVGTIDNNNQQNPTCVNYFRGKNIIKCAAGEGFSIFLDTHGNLFSCGDAKRGCLGIINQSYLALPTIISSLINTKITQISCGNDHILALSNDGKLYSWGSSKYGQLGNQTDNGSIYQMKPMEIILPLESHNQIKKIYCGRNESAFLTINAKIFVCGNNKNSKLGIEEGNIINKFTIIDKLKEKVKDVAFGAKNTFLVSESNKIILFGENKQQIIQIESEIMTINCGENFTAFSNNKNVVYFWGAYYKKIQDFSFNTNLEVNIRNPESILALYSPPEKIKSGNFLYLGGMKAKDNSLLVLIHTTTPPPLKQFKETDLLKNSSSKSKKKYWDRISTESVDLPNTPSLF